MASPSQRSSRSSSSLPAGYVEDKSKPAMLRFQDSLPRLPVPTLEETASRYLRTLKPLLSKAELENSTKAVQEFIKPGGAGAKLQEKLVARREDPEHRNWLYEWWNDAAYLSYRDPVVPYVSYFYSHRDDRRRRDPAKRAAAITTAALEFKKQVDTGSLEPEYMKKLPICMDSYKWMFNASRVAAKPADHPVKFDAAQHKYIIAIRKNRFYKIEHEVGGRQLNTSELEAQFRRVYQLADQEAAARGPALEYIAAASDGKGVDRHLFGLKRLLEPGQELPAIYQDPAYAYSSSWYLSTSQLSSEYFNGYGWSQVIDAGFGIAYMINENSINFNIVSKGLGSQKMSYYLNEAAGDMRDLLMPTLEAPKAKL
ncbi:carnitine O-acetyltransferase [Magnaporthiopsis poae ATCC 64411]|uniref:Carnitine O-acetyltransferase n=1 Tax=Magnaporthiopsis poae (strain ATCC 64411 / 73-15) TaxID=644358 RepID=A0A0C4DPF3_MAGP6|nr:carnitine O-acetyltransferase [Magnaporthiopsis poae ATCC 64411]